MKEYPISAEERLVMAEQAKVYRESDGREGAWVDVPGCPPAPVLLLTTRGRKSGKLRTSPLIYGQDGPTYLVVASLGGYDKHPQWYLNLDVDPEVNVQVGDRRFVGVARTADPDERARLWEIVAGIYPTYREYQVSTTREIPVVVLTPSSQDSAAG